MNGHSKRITLTTKPLLSLVSETRVPDILPTQQKKDQHQQRTNNNATQEDQSVEELIQHARMLKTGQEQVLYVCNHGSDEVSVKVLSDLLKDLKTPPKLDKVKDKNNGNCSLMHVCAIRNKPMCLEYLHKEHKLKIDILDNIESTPLLHAVANNSVEAVTFFLSKGANVNHKDQWGKFPLLIALKNRNYTIAELLLSQNTVDVHLRGVKGNTVLHMMATEGDLKAVQFLMEKCSASAQRRNTDEETVLQCCISYPELVKYMCSRLDRKILLKMVMNQNVTGCNIVHDCARGGHLDSLLLILKSVDIAELSPYQVNALLNTMTRDNDTPLLLAVKQMQPAVVRFLCQCAEVKLNEGDTDGNTALFHAGALKNVDIIDMLTSVKAALKAENKDGEEDPGWAVVTCIRSLKTLLATILFLIAFCCIITIAAISLGFFASNVSKSAHNIRTKSFDQTVTHIGRQFQDISLSEKMSYLSGRLNITDELDVRDYTANIFFTFMKKMPLVNLVYCTLADNSLAYWTKSGNLTSGTISWTSNYANKTRNRSYRLKQSLVTLENYKNLIAVANPTYGNTAVTSAPQRDYIVTASLHNDTVWTLSYPSTNGATMYLTVGHGIFDELTGQFLGSCQFDTTTAAITTYLKAETTAQKESVTIIVERQTGYLIGCSDPTVRLYTVKANTTTTIRTDGTTSDNHRLTAMLNFARKYYGGTYFTKLTRNQQLYDKFYYDGEQNALNIGGVTDDYGLDWIVIQAYPMKNFYGLFYNSIIIMCCATVALLAISLVLSIFVAHLFMQPINYLINQAEAIKLLQLEKVEKTLKEGSFFSEIKSLQQSFKSMTIRLKQFRNFIPDHILAVIEAEVGSTENKPQYLELQSTGSSEKKTQSGSATASISDGLKQKNIVNKALSSTLMSGAVTVMTVKFPDYAQILELYSAEDIDESSKELLSKFMDIIRIAKGQFVSIDSSKAVIAFNTFIKQSDHRIRACRVARTCLEALSKLQVEWKKTNLPILDVSIVISSGNLYYGNMGSNSMKYFTLIGSAVKRGSKMCKMCATWGAQILIDEKVAESTKEDFRMRPLQLLQANEDEKGVLIYELGEVKPADAWANDLGESKDGSNIWKAYCDAFDMFQSGRFEEAYELFVQYLQNHPSDTPAQNMLGICKQSKDEVTPSATLSDNTTTLVDN
jgi:ankyrin repeat protein/class 3 adenylate cyclase